MEDQLVCKVGDEAVFEAMNNQLLTQWFSDVNLSNLLATGNTFQAPITADTSFYVVHSDYTLNNYVGKIIPENNSTSHNGGFYLVFDALADFTLKSVLVRAQGAKIRTLQVRNENNEVVQSKEIFIPDGTQRININLSIPKGLNWQIGFAAGADLHRDNSGITYPYQLKDLVNIKQSTANNQELNFYYYLYNWEVEQDFACKSEVKKVNARVDICTNTETINSSSLIYPNPFTQYITVNTSTAKSSLFMYDLQGKEVYTKILQVGKNNINLSFLANGIYLVKIEENSQTVNYRLVKN